MDLIPSFSVDHTKIVPGIFTSRTDTLGKETITTYDVRVTKPNTEPVIDVAAMHSLEHLIAMEEFAKHIILSRLFLTGGFEKQLISHTQ